LALLLERGPPGYIDTKTSNGWYTPLHLACGRGHSEAANYLMVSQQKGAFVCVSAHAEVIWQMNLFVRSLYSAFNLHPCFFR
jgi:hypothetical protein